MWKYEEWRWDELGSRSCDNQVKWKAEMVTDDTVSNTPPFSAFLLDSLTLFDILWHSLTFVDIRQVLLGSLKAFFHDFTGFFFCSDLHSTTHRRDSEGSCGILWDLGRQVLPFHQILWLGCLKPRFRWSHPVRCPRPSLKFLPFQKPVQLTTRQIIPIPFNIPELLQILARTPTNPKQPTRNAIINQRVTGLNPNDFQSSVI